MGLVGYNRNFIEKFSKIDFPITALQKKETKFLWNEKCEVSFKKLKKLLTNAPVLKVVDMDKDFVVCTGACNDRLGGFISQENHVIAYKSQKLKDGEKNYATHDLELDAIIQALNM